MVCLHFPNGSPFEKYGGFDFGLDGWFFFILIEFESLEMTIPLLSKVMIIMMSLFISRSLKFYPNYWLTF